MARLRVQVRGIQSVERKFKQFGNLSEDRAEVLKLLQQVAKPTLRAAKVHTPISTRKKGKKNKRPKGNLNKSIGFIEGKKGQAKDNPTVYVGPRVKGMYDGYYGAWVHEGRNIYSKGFKRNRSKAGANNHAAKSRTKGDPYMTKAYEDTGGTAKESAKRIMTAYMKRRIANHSK